MASVGVVVVVVGAIRMVQEEETMTMPSLQWHDRMCIRTTGAHD